MIDIFPHIFATLRADTYFATTLGGFLDSRGNAKIFKGDEAFTTDLPSVTVDLTPGPQGQNTGWANVQAVFTVHGTDDAWEQLYEIAERIRTVFVSANAFAGGLEYQVTGDAEWSEGRDPVTETVTVSVALQFGC